MGVVLAGLESFVSKWCARFSLVPILTPPLSVHSSFCATVNTCQWLLSYESVASVFVTALVAEAKSNERNHSVLAGLAFAICNAIAQSETESKHGKDEVLNVAKKQLTSIRSSAVSNAFLGVIQNKRPGVAVEAVAQHAQTLATLTQKQSLSPPKATAAATAAALLESDVLSKQRNSATSSTSSSQQQQPGAQSVRKSDAVQLDERISTKTRNNRRNVARSDLRNLESQVAAKSRATSASGPAVVPGAVPAALGDLEQDILSKTAAPSDSQMSSLSLLESAIVNKLDTVNNNKEYDSDNNFDDIKSSMNKDEEDELVGVATITTGARGIVSEPDVEYGQMEPNSAMAHHHGDELAVAVEVKHAEDDTIIPDAIQYQPEVKKPIFHNRRFRLYGCLATVILILLVVMVAVGTSSRKVTKASDVPERNNPTAAPSTLLQKGIEEQIRIVVGDEKVMQAGSAYSRALQWILTEDRMKLGPDDNNLIQRYIAALFYMSLSERGPWNSCNPPDYSAGENATCIFEFLTSLFPVREYVPYENSRWLSETHECYWAGVTCDKDNVILAIELIGHGMTGILPPELVEWRELQSLRLPLNELYGSLPANWYKMNHLLNLELHYNFITGIIPGEWWTPRQWQLKRLNLSYMGINGTISSNIKNMPSLLGIQLAENQFVGSIPSELGLLSSMASCRLARNQFSGPIPTEVGNLKSLTEMWLHRNRLTGTIPTEVGNMVLMQDMRLQKNSLIGTIPEEIYTMRGLVGIEMYENGLTGTLSDSIGNLTRLTSIRLNTNLMNGTIPAQLGLLSNLKKMILHDNSFVGKMPSEVCQLRQSQPLELTTLQSDCALTNLESEPEMECDCCSTCCDDVTNTCLQT